MYIQPYLFFNGRCEEALEFYRQALGAEVTAMFRFKDNPDGQGMNPPGTDDKIMHANVQIHDTQIMVSDGRCDGQPSKFDGFSLTINVKDAADADTIFSAIGAGGQVHMPLTETFFADRFGMVADKFGVLWMIVAEKKKSA